MAYCYTLHSLHEILLCLLPLKKKEICWSYHHVCVSDSFHFVDIVTLDDGIEKRVKIIEEIYDL